MSQAEVTSCVSLLPRTSLQDPWGQLKEEGEGGLVRTQVPVPQELQGAYGCGNCGRPLGTPLYVGCCPPSPLLSYWCLVCLPGLLW